MADPVNILGDDWRPRYGVTRNVFRPDNGEVVDRAGMLPLGTYENGRTTWAWPGAIVEPIESFKNLLSNGYQPGDEQGVRDAFNVAGAAMTGGLVSPKPANVLGTFGGRLAKTADHAALAKAEKMAADGLPREQIWNDTGWFQGKDGKWRFEIDDSWARYTGGDDRVTSFLMSRGGGKFQPSPYPSDSLGAGIIHDNIYKAYPDMPEMSLFNDGLDGVHGVYERGNPAKKWHTEGIGISDQAPNKLSTGLHEMQHAVQEREGFARGGSWRGFAQDDIAAERARRSAMQNDTGWSYVSTYDPSISDEIIAKQMYHNLAGEAEARTVQLRRNLTNDQRRARAPWLDYDVPEDQQIVRMR